MRATIRCSAACAYQLHTAHACHRRTKALASTLLMQLLGRASYPLMQLLVVRRTRIPFRLLCNIAIDYLRKPRALFTEQCAVGTRC